MMKVTYFGDKIIKYSCNKKAMTKKAEKIAKEMVKQTDLSQEA